MLHDLGLLLSNKNPDRLFKPGSLSHFILISIFAVTGVTFIFTLMYYVGYYGLRMEEWLNLINMSDTNARSFVKCYQNKNDDCVGLGFFYTLIIAGILSGLFLIIFGCVQLMLECKKAYSSARGIEVECELLEIAKES